MRPHEGGGGRVGGEVVLFALVGDGVAVGGGGVGDAVSDNGVHGILLPWCIKHILFGGAVSAPLSDGLIILQVNPCRQQFLGSVTNL